jgi:hypothetical protein
VSSVNVSNVSDLFPRVRQVTEAVSWSATSSNLSEYEINERSCCVQGTVTLNIIL